MNTEYAKLDTGLQKIHETEAIIILLNEHKSDSKKNGIREGYRMSLLKYWLTNISELRALNMHNNGQT